MVHHANGKIGSLTTGGTFTEYSLTDPDSFPWGITVGSDNNLWFVEQSANNVASSSTTGIINEYAMPTVVSGPFDIAAGPDDNLWITEDYVDQIAVVTP